MSGFPSRGRRPAGEERERFSRLYDETSRDLLGFLLRRCATAEEAADCLAETYRIAWEKRARLPVGDQARPWLFGVARNVSRRERTREARADTLTRELAVAAQRSQPVVDTEDSEVIAALEQLSPLDREIITMLSWDGLAPREVATVLGLSANAVRIRSHRARARLRVALTAGDGDAHPQPVTSRGR